jgi:hypothetical protein
MKFDMERDLRTKEDNKSDGVRMGFLEEPINQEYTIRETPTYKFKRRSKTENLLPDGSFDFSKIPDVRIFAGPLLNRYRKNLDAPEFYIQFFGKNKKVKRWL